MHLSTPQPQHRSDLALGHSLRQRGWNLEGHVYLLEAETEGGPSGRQAWPASLRPRPPVLLGLRLAQPTEPGFWPLPLAVHSPRTGPRAMSAHPRAPAEHRPVLPPSAPPSRRAGGPAWHPHLLSAFGAPPSALCLEPECGPASPGAHVSSLCPEIPAHTLCSPLKVLSVLIPPHLLGESHPPGPLLMLPSTVCILPPRPTATGSQCFDCPPTKCHSQRQPQTSRDHTLQTTH